MDFTPSELSVDHPDGPSADGPAPDTGVAVPPWRRFVATGDSFTEGLWDVPGLPDGVDLAATGPDPGSTWTCRGWADLLAGHLADRGADLAYANLAVRGRLLRPILTQQAPRALELGADLVSLVGGGNDLLRPAADPDRLAADLETTVARLRGAGADVLIATGMDNRDSPIVSRTRGRVAVMNAHVWSIARRQGAHVLDLWGMRSLRDWRMWAPDRIHLTSEGHRRVAQGALVALGQTPDDPRWDDPLAPLPPPPRVERLREDARWVREHVYPWATRRLRGHSSGDRRAAKRPTLRPVREGAPAAEPTSHEAPAAEA